MKTKCTREKVLFIREREFTDINVINYGLGVLATLASEQFDVKVIDNNSKYIVYTIEDILKIIQNFKPAVICFSIATINVYSSYQSIAVIKSRHPEIPVVAGGLHVSNLYKEALDHKVDFAVRGEADLVIVPLLERLTSSLNTSSLNDIDIEGVSYYRGNELVSGGVCPLPMDLDNHTFIDYSHLYTISDFLRSKSDISSIGGILTQRGCPFKCIFCSDDFTRVKVRYRNLDNVMDEIEHRYTNYGVDIIDIVDADFTISKERVTNFCAALNRRGLSNKIQISCQSDTFKPINTSTLELMKNNGFTSIAFGIERMEEETQKRINKKLKKEVILKNLENTKKLGFVVIVNYLVGFSFESVESIKRENTLFKELLKKYADIVGVGIVMPLPGTAEYETNKDTLGLWYLNTLFGQQYKPLYALIKGLWFDPHVINFYSFDKNLRQEMIDAKVLFRMESIKKKSKILAVLFTFTLKVAKISEVIYYKNPDMEFRIFGKSINVLRAAITVLRRLWGQA